ncbi:hypothetical protein NEUTE2DRAFT_132864 [Neurospora tetrasperma FGSC 2509]|nr:hypothetical protein NEUTE2DRAFT_132864 [Neurospora tetrasperma FGSC 2509]
MEEGRSYPEGEQSTQNLTGGPPTTPGQLAKTGAKDFDPVSARIRKVPSTPASCSGRISYTHESTGHHQSAAMTPLPNTDVFIVNISVHFSITLWTSTANILKMPARKDYKKALEQIHTAL